MITPLKAAVAVIVLAAGGLVAALNFGLGRDPRALRPVVLDRAAPKEILSRLDGARVTVPPRGRPAVINFWASWCPPCVAEFPLLHEAWSRFGARVSFVGILYQDSPRSARKFLVRMGDPPNGSYANAVDPGSRTALDFGVYGLPETFFVDRRGIIRAKVVGELTSDTLEQNIRLILR